MARRRFADAYSARLQPPSVPRRIRRRPCITYRGHRGRSIKRWGTIEATINRVGGGGNRPFASLIHLLHPGWLPQPPSVSRREYQLYHHRKGRIRLLLVRSLLASLGLQSRHRAVSSPLPPEANPCVVMVKAEDRRGWRLRNGGSSDVQVAFVRTVGLLAA